MGASHSSGFKDVSKVHTVDPIKVHSWCKTTTNKDMRFRNYSGIIPLITWALAFTCSADTLPPVPAFVYYVCVEQSL